MRSRPIPLLLALGLFVGCQPNGAAPDEASAPDTAADEETLRQLATEWAAAEAANDIEATLGLMWEDAVMQPPNAPQIKGHEAIRALYESVTFESLDPGPLTVRVGGDLGVVWSPRMTYTLETPDGSFSDEGKFVAVWERRDGEWKVLENTWNTNLPAGGGGE